MSLVSNAGLRMEPGLLHFEQLNKAALSERMRFGARIV
jgi:hypothetical protein